jgi:hypothetical protein
MNLQYLLCQHCGEQTVCDVNAAAVSCGRCTIGRLNHYNREREDVVNQCPDHPNYKGLRKPMTLCIKCNEFYFRGKA